jgi:aryl-alcohol dehydrogenase-like predicted oxidoreductase
VVRIPGTKRRRTLEQNVRAAALTLHEGDLQHLDAAFPPGAAMGTRYPEAQLKGLGI